MAKEFLACEKPWKRISIYKQEFELIEDMKKEAGFFHLRFGESRPTNWLSPCTIGNKIKGTSGRTMRLFHIVVSLLWFGFFPGRGEPVTFKWGDRSSLEKFHTFLIESIALLLHLIKSRLALWMLIVIEASCLVSDWMHWPGYLLSRIE